jgi:hypothetical protein
LICADPIPIDLTHFAAASKVTQDFIFPLCVSAGAINKILIIGHGARFHIEAYTPNGSITAETHKGKIKSWVTLDAAAKWVRSIGIGSAQINMTHWQPGQRELI